MCHNSQESRCRTGRHLSCAGLPGQELCKLCIIASKAAADVRVSAARIQLPGLSVCDSLAKCARPEGRYRAVLHCPRQQPPPEAGIL